MTVARELAAFVTGQRYADLPPKAIEYAEMLISSTIASAALGSTIESSKIIRALEARARRQARGDALVRRGGEAARRGGGAGECGDERRGGFGRQRPAQHRPCRHDRVRHRARRCGEDRRQRPGRARRHRSRLRSGRAHERRDDRRAAEERLSRLHRRGLRRRGRRGTPDEARPQPQMAQAIAIIATSMGGLHAAANTSVAREYHAGLAAMLGVNAAQAAATGLPRRGEHPRDRARILRGLWQQAGRRRRSPAISASAGASSTDMGIKLVPGGHPSHATAEAAANAARAGNVAPDEVETITISRPGFKGLTGPQYPDRSHRRRAQPGVFRRLPASRTATSPGRTPSKTRSTTR